MFKRWELIFDWKEKKLECNRCKDVNNNAKYKKNSMVMCEKCLSNVLR
jgi:Zn finger protein HypA/HybF involved in hydrogenase expression